MAVVKARTAAGLLMALLVACGGGPTAPTPTPAPPPPPSPDPQFTVSGLITAAGAPVPSASVDVVAGINLGRGALTGNDGRYQLTGLSPGTLTIRVRAEGFAGADRELTLAADVTADFALTPVASATVGRVIDVLTGEGVSNVAIAGTDIAPSQSDLAGGFTLATGTPLDTPRTILFSRDGIVERQTALRVPGPEAVVSVISSVFDLTAFDQMFRSPVLRRWTTAPPLLIVDRVLTFESLSASSMIVRDEELGADEQSIVDDLSWALPQLTGGKFQSFASTSVDSPEPGTSYTVLVSGRITVARVQGLTAGSGFWGYSRWQWVNDEIIAGLVMLDLDFDTSGSPFTRSLRSHELGHALGYNHVTSRTSVMNSSARVEPTTWDLEAARLAFSRAPGNRSPDIDPSAYSANRSGIAVWGPPVR